MKSSVFNIIGGGLRIIITLISVPILIKLLGTKQFGIYSIANAVINIVSLAEWSIALSTTVLTTKDNNKNISSACFYSSIILGLFVFSVTILISTAISEFYSSLSPDDVQSLQRIIQIGSITMCLRVIQQYFVGIEQANNRYDAQNIINTVSNTLFYCGSIAFAYTSKSLLTIFAWQLIITFFSVITHVLFSIRIKLITGIKQLLTWSNTDIKKVLTYSSKIWPSAFGSVLFSQGDRLIVGKLLGLEATGIYTALTSIVNQINILSALPAQPLVSYVKSYLGTAEETKLKKFVENSSSLNVLLSIGIGIILICFSPEIINLLLGKWTGTLNMRKSFILLTIIYSVYSLNASGYYILFAVSKEKLNTAISLTAGLITLTSIFILSNEFGLIGAVVGNAGYWITLLLAYYGLRYIPNSFNYLIKSYIICTGILFLSMISTLISNLLGRGMICIVCILLLCLVLNINIKSLSQKILNKIRPHNNLL
ncbi:lipopolysaccharide biosynthesis protein [Fibrella aestuarina]|nr:oligosaccharide flippase family protein [Fibrella aestuarina]